MKEWFTFQNFPLTFIVALIGFSIFSIFSVLSVVFGG